MTMGYIDLPVITDSDVLLQQALANIIAAIPGWVPREGNLEVLLLEQFAVMAAEAATVASNVPATIFADYGSLVGVNPLPGTYETITVTFSLVAPAAGSPGFQIPAETIIGFYFSGAAYQFQTIQDYLIPTGETSIAMTLQAVAVGSDYDLDALAASSSLNLDSLYLQLNYQNPLVSNILLTSTPATNTELVVGTDPETTSAYLNRLAAELQLLAPRPITSSDYAQFAQNVPGIFRALAFDGVNPLTNWLSVANANFTLAATSGDAPSGWTAVGDGTNLPSLSTPGTAPANYLEVTTSSTELANDLPVADATMVRATSITVTTGSDAVSTSASPTNPAIIRITDATNGNEMAVVTGAAAESAGSQVLTLGAPLVYAHSTGATVDVTQGAALPLVGAAPGEPGVIAPNSISYIASTVVACGSDTTASEAALLVCLATYVDGSTAVFSSLPEFSDPLYDYVDFTKTLLAIVPTFNDASSNDLAPSASGLYGGIKPTLVSIQSYVVFDTPNTSLTHYITYNDVAATSLRFDGFDNPLDSESYWNFVPDSNLASMYFNNSAPGSWYVPGGCIALPGYGIQFLGTGTALGSALVAYSQIFNLSNLAEDVPDVMTRTYTLFATIDSSYSGSSFADVSVVVKNVGGTVLATLTPSEAGIATLVADFTISEPEDVKVSVEFNAGLTVPINSSVVISNIGVMGGDQPESYVLSNNDIGYSWTPGGLYSTNVFNYPRMVSVCPVDVNGLGVSDAVGDALYSYLAVHREINFQINVIQPSFIPIDVTWSGYVSPGYTVASVQAAVNAAIRNFLTPATWGGGLTSPPSWDGSAVTVRVWDISGIISSIPGVGSITSVATRLSYPTDGDYSTDDIVMVGIAPLPVANIVNGTLLTNPQNDYSGLT
jgi:Baseplate J-like protein